MDTVPRRFPFGYLVFAVVAGFVLAAAVGTGALFAFEGRFAERIYPGVRVAGVDVAGLDRDGARQLLSSALAGASSSPRAPGPSRSRTGTSAALPTSRRSSTRHSRSAAMATRWATLPTASGAWSGAPTSHRA